MRSNYLKTLKTAVLAATILLLGVSVSFGQQQINLAAGATTATSPDGSAVPMWGYSCGGVVSGSTATCASLNLNAGTNWSPVVITVPTGQDLQINLTNSLSFTAGAGTNGVATSLVIVGQLGAGLGSSATTTASPDHTNAQQVTWPIASPGPSGTPPTQGPRVQSFSTEVGAGQTTSLTWSKPRAGTYLIESGTHPSIQGPMGLYGILVVTTAPAGSTPGTAYPGVTYNADIPLLFSEIDPVQNAAVQAAVTTSGFSETMVWSGQPGGCGNPSSTTYHQCYPPAVNYTPLYYLINGVGFDKTNATASLFNTSSGAGAVSGTLLVRFVNAGLRMHVPSIVGAQTGTSSAAGLGLIAEDGNPLPGVTRVQSEVFMAAGKTYDVTVNIPASGATALPVYDRELSLSGNSIARDAGMLAYISTNSSALPSAAALAAAQANPDAYNSIIAGNTFTVSDPSKGVLANDFNVSGVKVSVAPTQGTLTLNTDGTFTYVAGSAFAAPDTFTYCGNGATSGAACAQVTLGAAPIEAATGITVNPITYNSNVATSLSIKSPGILSVDTDGAGYPLTVNAASVTPLTGAGTGTVSVDARGGFNATVSAPGTYTFTYKAQNSQGTVSATAATVTLIFPSATGLKVSVFDGKDKTTAISDYRWIIEEDRTFYINPACTTNPPPAGCPGAAGGIVPTFGTNFHTSYMPVVAQGCAGPTGAVACETGQTLLGAPAVCDIGNGICRTDAAQQTAVDPSEVHLDPTKRYYISVLPGDAANAFNNANGSACTSPTDPTCGHGMGGAPIAAGQTSVTILVQPNPFPTAKLSVFVFQDDFPLNGEQDAGGGIDVLATNEPGLGGFNITLFDDAGGTGDATGQMTYDMFNQPLSNSLAGTKDPATGNDACPISTISRIGTIQDPNNPNNTIPDPNQTGITGTIVTCPRYESDGKTLSPLAGQAVVANMMPGRYGVVATPGADRIARGEEWLQTNTLDGQKAHDSFLRIGEPSFFQEFGPAGYHVSIGFANPAIINARLKGVCSGTDPNLTGSNCTNTVSGTVTTERMSRPPDERLYSSGDNSSFAFTQCYVSLGDTDGEDFAFTKCDSNGHFTLSGIPDGTWRVTVFDQWNDMLVDGLSTPVAVSHSNPGSGNMGQIAMNQWQANIYTTTFFDANKNGVRDANEQGLTLVATNIRFRDGSYSNFNNTDLSGNAGFNEVFPLFSWYVIETDTTRYKSTGTHVVYDAGGPADTAFPVDSQGNQLVCPTGQHCSNIAAAMAGTTEAIPLPASLHVPGARYCASADCPTGDNGGGSTGRVDPAWVSTEGWQGFSGQNSFLEFGKIPFAVGENGGIHGEVIYASTRPFDDPGLLIHTSWTPDVPGVTINLYQEGTAPDGTTSLKLVDTTTTSSWDDWAQGFRSDGAPNMNCPGQGRDTGTNADLFFFTLDNQPMWLDEYNNGGTPSHTIPNNSQFKCYDGMHNWNQLQPAPYDGMYSFPSIAGRNPQTGVPVGGTGSFPGTNCTICGANPTDGTPMLPAGKYVVEMVVPPGYELVKEEDKNILIGDNYIAPVTQEFGGLGNVFILPDQAEVSSNPGTCDPATSPTACNYQQQTQTLGRTTLPSHEGDTGSIETFWPCVGASRVVPDYISLFPQSHEVSPFAGATRNLCDRKEVSLDDQTSVLAKFWVFTSAHVAAHFTGVITDDFTSEFDPFAPQFGEKFSPPNLPISLRDWTGAEISRVYTDQWGTYNGLTYSTWEVNPPNPTGYAPTMMVTCMNDPGNSATPDPLYNPEYSQFCYEIPFMPGQTQYMDTPVVPTSAFAGAGYNNPDCAYPDATPAISEVDGDGTGPWVSAAGHTLTIKVLPDQTVPNNAYAGPSATTAPFNQKTVSRHYGFGTTAGQVLLVGSDGVKRPLTGVSWGDTTITGNVPSGVPNCTQQQQALYGGSSAQCGQLVIITAAGKQSVDTVTVTIGGKAPTLVSPDTTSPTNSPFGPIQSAIDKANPGDLIMVSPGVYNEILLMWKPVRLQGVGAASSVINANSQPAGRMDPWRQRVNCLFGLALNGQPYNTSTTANGGVPLPGGGGFEPLNPYDPTGATSCPGTGWTGFLGGPNNPQVDRIPLEGILGWDTTLNGNLAELLQEPTLTGAYEGAGITVLAKGVKYPSGVEVFGAGQDNATGSNVAHEGQMPMGTNLLTSGDCTTGTGNSATNPYPSNFLCNPSSIDGLSITDSSQGGGGIYVHGWGHNLQIANNRVYNNTGTLTGGITVGQGESPDALLAGNEGDPVGLDQQPWTCVPGAVVGGVQNANPPGIATNTQLPYCYNQNVNVRNNSITRNSSIGDELFSSTPAGAGGVTFAVGSDHYRFTNNWLCGNMSTGDGGGVAHLGFSYNGDIEHNAILFNQSTNPTIPTNGGGLIVMGAAPDGAPATGGGVTECGSFTDVDCAPGLSNGTGPGMVINANLIMGNSADSGSGGGLRLQDVNGTEIAFFPLQPTRWNTVTVTNNIIANNVAGWDGAGVSLQDALNVNIINDTIMSNDTTASAGVLFNTLGAPLASSPGATNQTTSATTSAPQPAGLVSMQNTTLLTASLPALVLCPPGHGTIGSQCRRYSVPLLYNDVFWQNRSFYIGVGGLGAGTQNQQNVVALYNAFTSTRAATQATADATAANGNGVVITGGTGACPSPASYWDVGVRGDSGPTNHSSGLTLTPTFSVLTDVADYPGNNNLGANPTVVSQYCNGSRTPPEFQSLGYQVPPGISDATVPNPIFNLTPAATVDEGNNWINMSWGPLALTNAVNGTTLGNYALAAGSPAINYIPFNETFPLLSGLTYPSTDYNGNPRPATPGTKVDVGAVEFQTAVSATQPTLDSISPASHAPGGAAFTVTLTGTGLRGTGASTVNVSGTGITVGVVNVNAGGTTITTTFTVASGATLGDRSVTVTNSGGTSNPLTFTVAAAPTLASISPNTGTRGSSVAVTLTGNNFVEGATVNISGTGVTADTITVASATQITTTFTIASNAGLGGHNVSVTTPGGTTGNVTFTVSNPPAPTLASISPNTGTRGNSVAVTLTGANFASAGSTINVSGTGVTVSGTTVVSATQITATFTIAPNAAVTGAARIHNVSVTTPGGTTGTVTFTVANPPAPTLTSVTPNAGPRGFDVDVKLVGTNFTLTGGSVTVSGTGVTASPLLVDSSVNAETTLIIDPAAGLGPHTVRVVTPGGTSNGVTFTVQGPTLTSISPTSGNRGTTVPVTINGQFLMGATAVTISGTGVTANSVSATVGGTQVTANFTIAANAALGARTVTVVTPNGNTNTVPFTVTRTGPIGTVSLSGPLSISLPTGTPSATGTFTLTNVSTNSATVTISNVTVAGGTFLTYMWTKVNGQDHCTNATLAPGASCTVEVRFTNAGSARNGTNRTGTISFTDDANGTPQVGQLIGTAH